MKSRETLSDSGVRYRVIAKSDNKRYCMMNMQGEFHIQDELERGRDTFRVDERGLSAMRSIVDKVKCSPVKFGLDKNAEIAMGVVRGIYSTVKEGLKCPSCNEDDLNLCIEGRDVDTGKRIDFERCGSCFYSHYTLSSGSDK